MNFADRLHAAVEEKGTPCLLGLDPHPDLLPEEFAVARKPEVSRGRRADAVETFCCRLIDLAADRVAAVKPQSAFFEELGSDGVRAWESVVSHAHQRGLLVIGDVKRSDIASTAKAYARAFLVDDDEGTSCDAVTVSPYLGSDSVEPFVETCASEGKGLYVLVRTSNPGAAEFQRHADLCEVVARAVDRWGSALVGEGGWSSVGAVVGATHPDELASLRGLLPRTPLLLPGYGAQGAGATDVLAAFGDERHPLRGALVNSSRGIAFAYRRPENAELDWDEAASLALDAMIADLRSALERPAVGS